MESLGTIDRSNCIFQGSGSCMFCLHILLGSDRVPLNVPSGICPWHVYPSKIHRVLRFGRLQLFCHLGWWATVIPVKAPWLTPKLLFSPTYTTPWNVPSFKLLHLQKLSQSCKHKFLSLCCSSACHCHSHRTISSPSLSPQVPGPFQCAHIPLSLTFTCVSSPHP